jgi:glutamine transport system permease protein
MDFKAQVIVESLPSLLEGAELTLYIAAIGLVGGLALGIAAGLARAVGGRVARMLAFAYVESIRGTPIVVQAMFIYFALPLAIGLRFDALTAAILSIVINSGAYIAEIVRGAVLSIHKGFVEAGLALGLSRFQVLTSVIGPLAFRRMIPPLGNQFIISLKDTSLFIVIGVGELTRQGQEIMASNFRALEVWTAVAVIYLVMTAGIALLLRAVERRMRIL